MVLSYPPDEAVWKKALGHRWWWPVGFDGILHNRPQIVTLCGSTRFVEEFNEWRRRLTLRGAMIFSIEIVTTQAVSEDPQHTNLANKEMLDLLHKRKIDYSDAIFVINKDGYIGESTRSEIEYAKQTGRLIEYLEAI